MQLVWTPPGVIFSTQEAVARRGGYREQDWRRPSGDRLIRFHAMRRVMFHASPSLVEPAGAKVLKRVGSRCYLGILLETYHGENGQALYRGIYSDALIHDSSKGVAARAMKKAGPPQIIPSIGVEIYDVCTPAERISPAVTVNAKGDFTIKYKTRCPDVCDTEDPLSMSVARDSGLGIEIGMVMARIDMVVEGEAVEKYRVIFSDGEGYLTTRDDIEYMRDLFLNTPGLEPIVVLVIGA